MSEPNESKRPEPDEQPSPTEQLRIIGAEEAGSLVARRAESGEDPTWSASSEPPRSGRRAVFESVPDAPADLDDLDEPLSRQPRWAAAAAGADDDDDGLDATDEAYRPGEPDDDGDDVTTLGPGTRRPGRRPPAKDTSPREPARRPSSADDSGELDLPHWTAPPTGQVPRSLVDESRKDESWSTYASSPRWRDPSSSWDADFADVSDLADDDEPREGALSDRERPAIDEFFAFDDEADEPAPRTPPTRVAIDSRESEGRPAAPRDPTGPVPIGAPRQPAGRNVPVATALGVGLAALALALFRMGPAATMVLVVVIVGMAAAEFFDGLRRDGQHPATLLGLAAAVALPAAAYWRGDAAFPLIIGLTLAFGLLWFLFNVETERLTTNLGVTLLGVGYVGGLGAFAALILRTPGVDTTRVLLGGVVPIVAHDVLGYVVGRNAGRSPLLPNVSPNKTVEGLLGGCLGAIIASVVFNDLLGDNPWDGLSKSLLLGVVIAVLAPLGDLVESLLKRDVGLKDMGTALPGHGGVLDRFDAILFCLPGIYYLALLTDVLPH